MIAKRSTSPSRFVSGYVLIDSSARVGKYRVKIIGVDYSQRDSITIECSVLDQNGNHVAGLAPPYATAEHRFWNEVILRTSRGVIDAKSFSVKEVRSNTAPQTSTALIADYSGSMNGSIGSLISALGKCGPFLRSEDEAAIVQFDHTVHSSVPLSRPPIDINKLIDFVDLGGGTALYDGAMTGLGAISDADERKILVLFTDGFDNASLIDPNEVVLDARKQGVRIYCVGLGQVDAFSLNLISLITGGSAYFPATVYELDDIYEEIFRILRTSYRVTLPKSVLEAVDVLQLVPHNGKDAKYGDTTQYYKEPILLPVTREALVVALFQGNSNQIDAYWQVQVDRIASFLRANEDYNVELRGHTDTRGDAASNKSLGLERAETLKAILEGAGVDGARITTTGVGEAEPIWKPDTEEWQQRENRRVEARITKVRK